MLNSIFSWGLDVLAFVLPISIAATNIVFFPLAALWLFGAKYTFIRWQPTWGTPEKFFLMFLGLSLLSALFGMDPMHGLKEIKNKDFYILISVVLVALVRDRRKAERMMRIFMATSFWMAVWGLIQYAIGVNVLDKSDHYFLHLPARLVHWPLPVLHLLALVNGRVLGTRGHPLAYAECLLFNWALAICFLLSSRDREWVRWVIYLGFIGAALLVSQSRGPWIAAGVIAFLALVTSTSRRRWLIMAGGVLFLALFAVIPMLRDRAVSILDRSHSSNTERVHMWRAGWRMWQSHPLLGIGPGAVKGISESYQTAHEKLFGSWGHLHSIYVNFLTERGLFGLAAFFLFLGAYCRELQQALRESMEDPWRASVLQGTLLGIVGFLIGGLTETSYNTAVVMMTLYFVMGLALTLARHEQKI